jgi:hypothetical protein
MSEVKDEVGGTSGTAGTGGFGSDSGLGKSRVPGIALLFATYAVGLAWSPPSKTVLRVIVTTMAH